MFRGNVRITGGLFFGGSASEIDHPLDPENRFLRHSFVQSPDMLNVYTGTVTTDVAEEANGNQFTIRADTANVKVSWQITGVRRDPWAVVNRIAVDDARVGEERGRYLHPEVLRQPEAPRIPASPRRPEPLTIPEKPQLPAA